jgi:hypothetical protein
MPPQASAGAFALWSLVLLCVGFSGLQNSATGIISMYLLFGVGRGLYESVYRGAITYMSPNDGEAVFSVALAANGLAGATTAALRLCTPYQVQAALTIVTAVLSIVAWGCIRRTTVVEKQPVHAPAPKSLDSTPQPTQNSAFAVAL